MKKDHFLFIIFFSLFIGPGLCGISHSLSDPKMYDVFRQDTLLDYQILFNGRIWRNLYYRVKEDQFLFSPEFLPGSLTISGRSFKDINIKYDIYNDEIIIPTNHGTLLQLNKEKVDSFNITFQDKSYHFSKIREDSLKGFNGYLNVLYNGDTQLYVKYRKEISLLAVEGKYDIFHQNHRIYIIKDNIVCQVNTRRELYKILDEYKLEIRSFVKNNRLSVSIKKPESIVPVIQHYDRLSQ